MFQLRIFECDIVGLSCRQYTDALVVGQLAKPAIAHRPGTESAAVDARPRMAGVDYQRDIGSVYQPKPHRQFGRGNQRGNVRFRLSVGPFGVCWNQKEIALRLRPAVPRVTENDDVVGSRDIENRSVDAVSCEQLEAFCAILRAAKQRQYHRDGIGGNARLPVAFARDHQSPHVITVEIGDPSPKQFRVGCCIIEIQPRLLIGVDADRNDEGTRLARLHSRSGIFERRGIAFHPVLVERIDRDLLHFGASSGRQVEFGGEVVDAVSGLVVIVDYPVQLAPVGQRIL